ncbi:MAG: gamma-glutamyl-gamma-aminobutyrate hydrolase family protein [Bacteroidia bacterium]
MSRPNIGVTGPDVGGEAAWLFTAYHVWSAGGRPIWIRPSKPKSHKILHGLIIGGGADVDPNTYEQEDFLHEYLKRSIHAKRGSLFKRTYLFFKLSIYALIFYLRKFYSRKGSGLDKNRDVLEFNLLEDAEKANLPVLGICRGAQLINIYFGGSLFKDINEFYTEHVNVRSVLPVKQVYITPHSKLAKILCAEKIVVNALHSQAVKKPGKNIVIVGREPSQVVQAIESTAHEFLIGVQWHPEYLVRIKSQRQLFSSLVSCAKAKMQAAEKKNKTD